MQTNSLMQIERMQTIVERAITNGLNLSTLLSLLLLMAGITTGRAQSENFVFEDDEETVIIGLTYEGMAARTLTIPASVTTVREGAFDYARSLLSALEIDGADVLFEDGSLDGIHDHVSFIDVGGGMTADHIYTMLKVLGPGSALQDLFVGGYTDAPEDDIQWTEDTEDSDKDDSRITDILTADVNVTLPAQIVADQTFGHAKVYGRITMAYNLTTFAGKAPFIDDDNSNCLFYVPTEMVTTEDGDKAIRIQRVWNLLPEAGIVIQKQDGSATYVDLARGSYPAALKSDNELYAKSMMVGCTEATPITPTTGDKTNFGLASDGMFHPLRAGAVPAGKAYLQIPTSTWTDSMAKLQIQFPDTEEETTSINHEQLTLNNEAGAVYDLQGRKVSVYSVASVPSVLPKSIYITGGKKIIR